MYIEILDYKTLDLNNINYNDPEKVKGGSYMSIPTYNNNPIYIQSPRLNSNNGIVKNDSRCYIELELDNSHWEFYEFITNIDEYNMDKIHKNSSKWFSKEFPLDIVEEFYKTPIKNGKANKPPMLKLKIPVIKGDITCNIYNSNNNTIHYNDIKNDVKILCVLKLQGLRFLKQQVICEWVPLQLKVFQSDGRSTYIINDNLLTDMEDNGHNNDILPTLENNLDQTIDFNNIESVSLDNCNPLDESLNKVIETCDIVDNSASPAIETCDIVDNSSKAAESKDNESCDMVDNSSKADESKDNESCDMVYNSSKAAESKDNESCEMVDNYVPSVQYESTELNADIGLNEDAELLETSDLLETTTFNENTRVKSPSILNKNKNTDYNSNTDQDLELFINNLQYQYEEIINNKEKIIMDMSNKLNKLKEFIN